MDKQFDVVIWGCTGFTGGLVAEYYATSVSKQYPTLKWALAGRNPKKLQSVLERVKGLNPTCNPPIIQASVDDQQSIDSMVGSTRVLLSTAGPFVQFGTPIVDACVRLGSDYVDTTGETPWVRSLIDKGYHQRAIDKGVYIVPMCGFDSVPSDLGTYMLGRASCDKYGEEKGQLDTVKGYFTSNGGPSGGTLRSGMGMNTTMKQQFDQVFLLGGKKSTTRAEDEDVKTHSFEKSIGLWTAPFGMAGINTRVVRRSTELNNNSIYSNNFSYNEVAICPNEKIAKKMANPPPPEVVQKLIDSGRLPKPGEGPSAATRAKSFFGAVFIGVNKEGIPLILSVKGGDPGYTETSKMVSEAALCLVLQRTALKRSGGVITPSYAFGDIFLQRLQKAGISFTVEKVGEYTPTDIMKVMKTFGPIKAKL